MGQLVEGVDAAILGDDGARLPDGEQGNLCLQAGWPSMFVTYLNNEDVYRKKFLGNYYLTGDTAVKDSAGYFWFRGRSDDVINTAGHLVSPFEVESALLEIEEVAESGVIGVPDELLFEKVVAYVSLHRQFEWTRNLELKIRLYVSNKVSTIATPQEIFVVGQIPKNKSGKIMRRMLKAGYMGTDAGDLSTLEE
jgi:acetyl-CoA synthetase